MSRQQKSPQQGKNNQEPPLSQLNDQIKDLENRLKNTPDSDSNKEILQQEIEQLKKKLRENNQSHQPNKNNSSIKLVIGGGVIIVVLLIVIAFLLGRQNKRS
ncbi:MAG: Endolytic murein transglycosylase [Mycoplasmataceae bacterium]|nr:MAG: Endolytic murein transglycosylase [Mycoplasmataceae bacterium]